MQYLITEKSYENMCSNTDKSVFHVMPLTGESANVRWRALFLSKDAAHAAILQDAARKLKVR